MKKTIKEDKKSGTITLKVDLPNRRNAEEDIINFLTRDAKLLLAKEGYNISGCRKKDSITNHRSEDKHSGEWVFVISNAESQVSVNKKNLTKDVDPAIINSKKGNTTKLSQSRKGK